MNMDDQLKADIATYIGEALSTEHIAQATRDAQSVATLTTRATEAETLAAQLGRERDEAKSNLKKMVDAKEEKERQEKAQRENDEKAADGDRSKATTIVGSLLIAIVLALAFWIWRLSR